ncbi:ATPase domain-containing protein [Phycisphaerales bacterium AB-hyl4]|uniref:ATPase domain-containing protein n=1 Tax=Natronomicrosphaera hydrolytica TaxID=3242702 RepID=A0ABV4U366_9BACT
MTHQPHDRHLASSLLAAPDTPQADLPLSDEMAFLTDALSQFAVGGLYLLGGTPGSGKSLLALQVALDLAKNGHKSLMLLTEQGSAALKQRAIHMASDLPPEQAKAAIGAIDYNDTLRDVASLPAYAAREILSPHGRHHGVKLVVLDSIQGEGLAGAATKAYGKVLEFGRLCASAGITTVLVSHVTKRGDLAGPKTLEHGVDGTLLLRRAMLNTLLAVRKNRFGPPLLRPMPLVIDPLTMRLAPAPHAEARPGAARTFSGSLGLMEVQAAVAVPPDGRVGRTTAPGLPRKEIEQLLDCIGQIEGLELSDLDYRIQCRLPRSGQYIAHFGLPLCIALVASFTRKPVPADHLYLGEIDLFRQVREVAPPVLDALVTSLAEGQLPSPLTLVVPPSALPHLPAENPPSLRLVPCATLEEAIYATWPELR